jgi:hypothetical protein
MQNLLDVISCWATIYSLQKTPETCQIQQKFAILLTFKKI